MISTETLYLIALSKIKHLGRRNLKHLVVKMKSAMAVYNMSKSDLIQLNVRKEIRDEILNRSTIPEAEKEIRYAEKNGIQIINYFGKDYPDLLKQCSDAPLILYVKGNVKLFKKRILAVVGTRKASHQGKELCKALIADLREEDVVIVSGLALGIDSAAHENALINNMETWAVLGHGFNRLYPAQNLELSEKILKNGALITDFSSTAPVLQSNFPSRNRIIAGISHATLVVESGQGGGSLITAGLAMSYSRDVFTFPTDPLKNPGSACNELIKQNAAALIDSAEDVLKYMNWNKASSLPKQVSLFPELNADERKIMEILMNCAEMRLDDLSIRSAFPIHKLSGLLLSLELKKMVICSPGKIYRSCSK